MTRVMVVIFIALAVSLLPACEREDLVAAGTEIKGPSGPNPFVRPESRPAPSAGGEAQAAPAESGKQPRAVFEQVDFDFGEIEAGETVEHVYRFRNAGQAVLIVEKVQSG